LKKIAKGVKLTIITSLLTAVVGIVLLRPEAVVEKPGRESVRSEEANLFLEIKRPFIGW